VTQTVGAVGYAAAGLGGGILAAAVAFLPSFLIVGLGADRFERLRGSANARAFLDGAGPAAIGAILGAAVPLADGLGEAWQLAVLAAAAVALLASDADHARPAGGGRRRRPRGRRRGSAAVTAAGG
jgi:chromate transporter